MPVWLSGVAVQPEKAQKPVEFLDKLNTQIQNEMAGKVHSQG